MRICRTNILLISTLAAALFAGCEETQSRAGQFIGPDDGTRLVQQPVTTRKRFQETTAQAPTAVESAIELSKKYGVLAEEMSKLKDENQRLVGENRGLKDRLGPCESQLAQAQKELTEANDLLLEMRLELNNWKMDVLGFRNELRDADQAQLEALLKILAVLGGEVKTSEVESRSAEQTSPAAGGTGTRSNDANQSQEQQSDKAGTSQSNG